MLLMKLGFGLAVVCAMTAVSYPAAADDPVIVEYVAPDECASTEAFHALLAAQIARTPNPERTWRFSVRVVHADDAYIGRVTTETGTRELHARTCDEVVSALALVIAMATPPEAPAALPPPPAPPSPPPPPPVTTTIAPPRFAMVHVERDRIERKSDSSTAFRFGIGAQDWANTFSIAGPTLTASIEPRWGWYRMMFEMNVGVQAMGVPFGTELQQGSPAGYTITWTMLDFESCPIDIALGDSNVSLIACNSLAVGIAGNPSNAPDPQPGALFFGGDGRVRWQSPWKFFAEAHVGALISTQSGPWASSNGLWMNIGAQVGLAL